MHLLSALSSTTSPLAMQATPLAAPSTGDFAALIAGMAPAGDAATLADPVERQGAAPGGNGLPLTIAAPVALPGTVSPVVSADTVPAIVPPLPVSATEAVLMLPQEADAPIAPPVPEGLAQAAPVLATMAAIGGLAKLLPEEEPAATSPRVEDVAARTLQMPVPTRFAAPPPRVKRAETPTPDAASQATEEEGVDPDLAAEADTVFVPLATPSPVVPQPADAVVIQAAPPADGSKPTASVASLVIEGGEVVAQAPASTTTPPMRLAKRAGDALPASPTRTRAPVTETSPDTAAPAKTAEPAIGVVTPLDTDTVLPVHVVVPMAADGAAPVPAQPTASSAQTVASAGLRSVTPASVPATPGTVPTASAAPSAVLPAMTPASVTSAVPGTAAPSSAAYTVPPAATVAASAPAGTMIGPIAVDGPSLAIQAAATVSGIADAVPIDVGPTPLAAVEITGIRQVADAIAVSGPAVTAPPADAAPASPDVPARAVLRQPTIVADTVSAAPFPVDAGQIMSAPIERVAAMPVPAADPALRAPMAAMAAGETVVALTPSAAQPAIVVTPPVTRVAAPPVSEPAVVAEALPSDRDAVAPAVRRTTDAPASTPAAMPPVTRIAAAPVVDAAQVVDVALGDSDTVSPRARRDDDPAVPTTGATTALDTAVLRPVAPTAHAAQPTLDTRQPQWMEGMIDRITTLREASGSNGSGETRIRLSPDSLGDVEVAIRTGEDGKLHVHFASENAEAGRLLADAQPRLVQMAEARGLKLGGMQVDVGSQQSQQSQRQAQDQGNPAPRTPRSTTTTANSQTTRSDDRIA